MSRNTIDKAVKIDPEAAKWTRRGAETGCRNDCLRGQELHRHRSAVQRARGGLQADVVAALGKLRDLLQGDVGVAAPVLKTLVGDVVVEKRQVEVKAKPRMVARFTINAVPALAMLERHASVATNDAPKEMGAAVENKRQREASDFASSGPRLEFLQGFHDSLGIVGNGVVSSAQRRKGILFLTKSRGREGEDEQQK